jgi:hypothetical protein
MEFNFYTSTLFKCNYDGIGILDGTQLNRNSNQNFTTVLDTMGDLSAKVSK